MDNKISTNKIIADIKATKGNRSGCQGLHSSLESDGYLTSIFKWARATSPKRIDALVELIEKQETALISWEKTMMEVCGEDGPASVANEIRVLQGLRDTAMQALKAQVEQLAAENAGLKEQVRALAADNSALINSSVCALQDGRPLHGFYASEWFIAKLKNGEYAALKALPEEYSYDYRTNDGTYYTKDWVVVWMQTPDTEYRPNVKTPATDAYQAGIKADGVEEFAESQKEYLRQHRSEMDQMLRAAYAGSAVDAEKFAKQLREGAK